MCGIFGLVVGSQSRVSQSEYNRLLETLFLESESRGKEAAGVAFCVDQEILVVRKAVPASELLRNPDYTTSRDKALARLDGAPHGKVATIGHARLVTNGLQGIDANNQPVVKGNVVCVHNGIIVNESLLWAQEPDLQRQSEVDTEVVAALVDRALAQGHGLEESIRSVFGRTVGEASLAFVFSDRDEMALATNTGSLFVVRVKAKQALLFCSERAIAQRVIKQMPAGWQAEVPVQIGPGRGLIVDLADPLQSKPINLVTDANGAESSVISVGAAAPPRPSTSTARRSIATSTDVTYKRWLALRRCTRCVLPETMPFIAFDSDGVCNYCRSHTPPKLKGEAELERVLERYRRNDGEADCLVGFSGGRDSSYGLHLLKTRYGMNPIAYTYDWGMVTDLARRNQARICGKLGVEHIWVSADIKKKRRNVRQNVEAWLRKPDLGMVPLFMAGDKQFMWHANRLMKETDLHLMVYSTNQYERTDFKTGFCGVLPASAEIQLNRMSSFSKMQLLLYYLKSYATNPGYLNSSLSDTFTAFLSYYFVKQDFLYLFDYVPWDENEINSTLIREYDWELAKDTPTTWRIGDGTAPFYNYIYMTVAGFSEYETFRSNQIREGVIGREEALRLIREENVPRLPSIQEYCQLIGLDFDYAMRVIDNVRKLY
jgi:glucosamine--fructose-6-phosphate aminotransferase (isomerizing)